MGRTFRSTVLMLRKARSTFERLFGKARAQHVDPVKCGLLRDSVLVDAEREVIGFDGVVEVLGHLVLVHHLAYAYPDVLDLAHPLGQHAGA